MSEIKNETVSLETIKSGVTPVTSSADLTASAKPVDITEHIKPKKSEEDILVEKEYEEIDQGIGRFLNEIEQERDEMFEEEIEKAIDADEEITISTGIDAVTGNPITLNEPKVENIDDVKFEDDDTTETTTESTPVVDTSESLESIKFLDDEDEEEEEEESDTNKEFEQFKSEIKAKITTSKNAVDFSSYKISKKAVGISRILSAFSQKQKNTADWVLYTSKRPISIQAMNVTDIEKFNPESSGRNTFNMYKEMYHCIYNNLIDANKPDSFEAWTKSLNFYDLPHLYFAIYKANFGESTSLPYSCPKCKKISMLETITKDMIKYASPEVEAEVKKILSKDTTSPENIETNLVQLSDDYACSLTFPTVYSVIFENASLDEAFRAKYSDLLGIISYIDDMYLIDRNTQSLVPISTNPDPSDIQKSTKRKVKAYNEIIKTLDSDQYNSLLAEMKKLNDMGEGIEYRQPDAHCPECGELIPERVQDPISLLFTRHQLVALANL